MPGPRVFPLSDEVDRTQALLDLGRAIHTEVGRINLLLHPGAPLENARSEALRLKFLEMEQSLEPHLMQR